MFVDTDILIVLPNQFSTDKLSKNANIMGACVSTSIEWHKTFCASHFLPYQLLHNLYKLERNLFKMPN